MAKKKSEASSEDEGATFDMYHFFSRKDVILMILFILAMLAIILYQLFTNTQVA